MNFRGRVDAILQAAGLPASAVHAAGYRVKPVGPTRARVYWGRGRPFHGTWDQDSRGLLACHAVLVAAGLQVDMARHEDARGAYVVVAEERPPEQSQ